MDRDERLDTLLALNPGQYEELLERLAVPRHFLPGTSAPHAERVIALHQYFEQPGRTVETLTLALARIQAGQRQVDADQPPDPNSETGSGQGPLELWLRELRKYDRIHTFLRLDNTGSQSVRAAAVFFDLSDQRLRHYQPLGADVTQMRIILGSSPSNVFVPEGGPVMHRQMALDHVLHGQMGANFWGPTIDVAGFERGEPPILRAALFGEGVSMQRVELTLPPLTQDDFVHGKGQRSWYPTPPLRFPSKPHSTGMPVSPLRPENVRALILRHAHDSYIDSSSAWAIVPGQADEADDWNTTTRISGVKVRMSSVAREVEHLRALGLVDARIAADQTIVEVKLTVTGRQHVEGTSTPPSHQAPPDKATNPQPATTESDPTMDPTTSSLALKIGIITALPKESAAMKAMLDHPVEETRGGRNPGRRYTIGDIPSRHGGAHRVALCLLPDMGNNIASVRAALLLEDYPSVESIIMVGIAGGVPYPTKPEHHVRLGDIVVSDRRGVIQYDLQKQGDGWQETRASPRPPSAFLLDAVRHLEADWHSGEVPWMTHVPRAAKIRESNRPSGDTDKLADSQDQSVLVEHPDDKRRTPGEPLVFTGPIASSNTLLKDPKRRDALRDGFGVKAVEMEASGVADATWDHGVGYLVVRGVCDYCDSNKGDEWQGYAAVVAAAYTRALLESMPAQDSTANPS